MGQTDFKANRKEHVEWRLSTVFLNYKKEDEVYVIPIRDILSQENIEFVSVQENKNKITQENMDWEECDMLVSIVTDSFLKDPDCIKALSQAKCAWKRRVSILFCQPERDTLLDGLLGEKLDVSALGSTEDYLLHSLYHEEAFGDMLGEVEDPFRNIFKPILKGSIVAPDLVIGSPDTTILAVGSMGYSTVKLWHDLGFRIMSEVILVHKDPKVRYGQPDFQLPVKKWYLNIENEEKDKGTAFLLNLKREIAEWLERNVPKGNRLILLGGLGRTTASFLIPQILCQANHLGIVSSVVCSLPFAFESHSIRELGLRSFDVICKMAENVYYFNGEEANKLPEEKTLSLKEYFSVIGYAVAVAVNVSQENNATVRSNIQEIIIMRENRMDQQDVKKGRYGLFEILFL